MEKIFKISNKEFLKKKEEHKRKMIIYVLAFSIVAIILYFFVFRTEKYSYLLIPSSSLLTISLFFYATKIALRDSLSSWNSYTIKITENEIMREYEKPIYNEFQKTHWKKITTIILWENVNFKEKNKLIISDNTLNDLEKNIVSEGIIIIPKEIENKIELIKFVVQNIENKNYS